MVEQKPSESNQQAQSEEETCTDLQTVDIGSIDMNLFALCKANTRLTTFVQLSNRFVAEEMAQVPQLKQDKFNTFLQSLFSSYRQYNVSYHNDMHCLDVAQMTYILLKTGPDCLSKQLQLSPLDYFSVILAALSHDFAHDGFNNGYHTTIQSERFRVHGNIAVQEKYHFTESCKVLEQSQLLCDLPQDQVDQFKLRMMQCILSTDMARHMEDLNEIKAITQEVATGAPLLPAGLPITVAQKRKTQLIELAVHSSDISFLARRQDVQKVWAYKLFEEFFHQGDVEREAGSKISFLCDRETSNVAKSQKGFIGFGPMPLFKAIAHFCPSKAYIVDRLEKSGSDWEAYAESESGEHKQVYVQTAGQGFLDESWP